MTFRYYHINILGIFIKIYISSVAAAAAAGVEDKQRFNFGHAAEIRPKTARPSQNIVQIATSSIDEKIGFLN